jgi:hypothetical protein
MKGSQIRRLFNRKKMEFVTDNTCGIEYDTCKTPYGYYQWQFDGNVWEDEKESDDVVATFKRVLGPIWTVEKWFHNLKELREHIKENE